MKISFRALQDTRVCVNRHTSLINTRYGARYTLSLHSFIVKTMLLRSSRTDAPTATTEPAEMLSSPLSDPAVIENSVHSIGNLTSNKSNKNLKSSNELNKTSN